jgi:hypothetical protein
MYPKIKTVKAKNDYTLEVTFSNDETRLYDIKPLLNQDPFSELKQNDLFLNVVVDVGGYGISWNDFIDLSEYELYTKSTLI